MTSINSPALGMTIRCRDLGLLSYRNCDFLLMHGPKVACKLRLSEEGRIRRSVRAKNVLVVLSRSTGESRRSSSN